MPKRDRDPSAVATAAEPPPKRRNPPPVVDLDAADDEVVVVAETPAPAAGHAAPSEPSEPTLKYEDLVSGASSAPAGPLEDFDLSEQVRTALRAELQQLQAPLDVEPEDDDDDESSSLDLEDPAPAPQAASAAPAAPGLPATPAAPPAPPAPPAPADADDQDDLDQDYDPAAEADGAEQPASSSHPPHAAPKGPPKRKPKPAFFDPRMWPAGGQDRALMAAANAAAGRGERPIKCFETGMELDLGDEQGAQRRIGSVWSETQRSPLSSELFKTHRADGAMVLPGQSPTYARTDFLKACFRLGRMVDPEKLSVLLGGRWRHPEYCAFILAGLLGLLHVRKARQLGSAGGMPWKRPRQDPVIVRADGEYASDDALGTNLQESRDASPAVPRKDNQVMVNTFPEMPKSDEEDADGNELESVEAEFIRYAEKGAEHWAGILSYVQRTYLCNLCGIFVNSFAKYASYASRVGVTFEAEVKAELPNDVEISIKKRHDRMKWKTEPMPAPELGELGSVKLGTIDLWRSAVKDFSVKHISRCALIQSDRLLDWLTYVSHENACSSNEAEFYRDRMPPVSIAPIPMLYLADLAADLVLKVVGVAAHLAVAEPLEDGAGDLCRVISEDDILFAAGWVLGEEERHRLSYHLFGEPPLDFEGRPTPCPWPQLLERSLTPSENIVICDRPPVSSIKVPLNAIDEVQAVLMSYRHPVRRFLYTKINQFNAKDPIQLMKGEERAEATKAAKELRRKHGIHLSIHGGPEDIQEANLNGNSEGKGQGDKDIDDETGGNPSSGLLASAVRQTGPDQAAGSEPGRDVEMSTDQPVVGRAQGLDETEELFRDQVNVAELVASRIGVKNLVERRKATENRPGQDQEAVKLAMAGDLAHYLKVSEKFTKKAATTVCYHRLGWICLHALGQDVEDNNTDEDHLLGYGSSANYTNFGELGVAEQVTLSRHALDMLVQLADQAVRREAETLMACAAHDDGRPWIDRADVVLVTSVRKEQYRYGDVGRSVNPS